MVYTPRGAWLKMQEFMANELNSRQISTQHFEDSDAVRQQLCQTLPLTLQTPSGDRCLMSLSFLSPSRLKMHPVFSDVKWWGDCCVGKPIICFVEETQWNKRRKRGWQRKTCLQIFGKLVLIKCALMTSLLTYNSLKFNIKLGG